MTATQDTNAQDTHSQAPQRTALYQSHVDSAGKLVDFSGWELPIHYGSQIEEHEAVRSDAGMFDVSHMVIVDVKGSDAKAWLQKLLANDVAFSPLRWVRRRPSLPLSRFVMPKV